MIFRVAGAFLRAFLVIFVLALPSLLLPQITNDGAQFVALVALFASGLIFFEYISVYPGIIEFRDAPPFNRMRFVSLLTIVLLLSLITRGVYDPSTLTNFVEAVGALIGHAIDFPYSPVRLVLLMLPDTMGVEHITVTRAAAGISYFVSVMTVLTFLLVLKIQGWPGRGNKFNVWVNLPTFDPTTGGDVVARLERYARFNIALGFLLPFLFPAIVKGASVAFGSLSLENPLTLIWTITAWAYLPTSILMRGIAMGRIGHMIEDKRRRASAPETAYLPV